MMVRIDLRHMSSDELWTLHETITPLLDQKIREEANRMQSRIAQLGRNFDIARSGKRRAYPPVVQKYFNPNDPSKTWSGRGKRPKWVSDLLGAGKGLNDLRHDAIHEMRHPGA